MFDENNDCINFVGFDTKMNLFHNLYYFRPFFFHNKI